MDAFVTPVGGWTPPKSKPRAVSTRWQQSPEEWSVPAQEHRFEHAIICYLWGREREQISVWRMVSDIVNEACTTNERWELHWLIRQVLSALTSLRRTRRVLRKKKKFLVLHDPWIEIAEE